MDLVEVTPAKKRRKLANCDRSRSQTYDSQNDSGDDIFADYETVPLSPNSISASPRTAEIISPPSAYITQPTQLLRKASPGPSSSGRKPSVVQVAVSSPIQSTSPSPVIRRNFVGGRLASSLAPAGTAFKPPKGVIQSPVAPIVDISDDEPSMRGASSDDDSGSGCRADIKPSIFTYSGQKGGSKAAKPTSSFKEILSNSFYKPLDSTMKPKPQGSTPSGSFYDKRNQNGERPLSRTVGSPKPSGDTMADAYGASRRPPKPVRQTGPAKALPAAELEIDDIEDYQLRSKISRMRQILPHHTVRACKDALERRKFNFDDAMEFLASQEIRTTLIDITSSGGEEHLSTQVAPKRTPAKQQIKAPNLKIQDKWAATQARNTQDSPSLLTNSSTTVRPKRRRRLIQGRKQQSSPVAAPKEPSPSLSSGTVESDPDDSDSGVGTGLDSELDHRALDIFNTCSIPDLVDLTGITEDLASVLLSQRPFTSLDDVRRVSSDAREITKTKRKAARKPFGDKIVDKCLNMLTGYDAIDKLVKQCEDLAKPVREDMKGWGVNIFGAAMECELEIVSFNQDVSPRDSAIGTPNSIGVSDEEEILRKTRRHAFFPQPSIMANGIQLKDYQVSESRRVLHYKFMKGKAECEVL